MFDGVSPNHELIGVNARALGHWIERVSPHLRRMAAGSGGRFSAQDIADAIVQRDMQLWIILNGPEICAAVVTSIVVYPQAKALRFMGCVGQGWRDWIHLRDEIEDWGRRQGATIAEGWVPHEKWGHMFPGYELDHMMLVKVL